MASKLEFDRPPALVILPMPETRPTGLEIMRSLGRAGVPVIALSCERRPPSFASRYVARRLSCPNPREDEEEFVDYLTSVGRLTSPKPVLFAAADPDVMLIATHQDRLRPFFAHPYVPVETIVRYLDKHKMYEKAREVGIILPRTNTVQQSDDVAQALREAVWPSVVKPIGRFQYSGQQPHKHREFISIFGSKAIRVHDRAELGEALRAAVDAGLAVLVQEEVPGAPDRLYLVCVYADEQSRVRALFTGRKIRQYPVDFGSGSLTEGIAPPEHLVRLTEAFVRNTAYRGIANFEWKLDERNGEYKFMEVNPRCWTWTVLAQRCGVNLPYVAYLDLTGAQMPDSRQGLMHIRFLDVLHDLKYFMRYRNDDYLGRGMTVREYLQSLKGPKEYAFFAADDRRPGWRHLRRQLPELARLLARAALRRGARRQPRKLLKDR